MRYTNRPLYPPPHGSCNCRDESFRMPLFGCEENPPCDCWGSKTVRLENPCCPGECAEVTLRVDNCGNLQVSVKRQGSAGPAANCCRSAVPTDNCCRAEIDRIARRRGGGSDPGFRF